jgi:hypothetical protein
MTVGGRANRLKDCERPIYDGEPTAERLLDRNRERRLMADSVEKVAARRRRSARRKMDLSDRPTRRSCVSVKGKVTHENLPIRRVTDFFNTIGRLLPTRSAERDPNPSVEDADRTSEGKP